MNARTIIKPIEPVDERGAPLPGWVRDHSFNNQIFGDGLARYMWVHEYGVRALTGVEVVEELEHPEASGPHFHVSLTRWRLTGSVYEGPLRIDSVDAAYVLREFFGGFEGWEEDNHVPGGKARNFWRPVAEPRIGMECFCKKHEPRIFEDGGDYVWRPL